MRGNVDTIKERLDITDVISNYVKLEKSGSNFKAKCPFHNEKTPSFFVSPTRQSFYCFGCGAKGDMFSFIEEIEGVDFRGALKLLADKAGVEIEYQSKEAKTEKDRIFEAILLAVEFYEERLKEHPEAVEYLTSRGIGAEAITKWRLGYVPNEWRLLFKHLTSLGFNKELLLKAGLIKKVEENSGKEPYDVFRGRIIFPLSDRSGRITAFSGRALSKDLEPKYLNSPDTVLFNKGETLYGFDKAKESIRRKNYTVLVEGQLDLILSHESGVENTVASSGTAFTPAHLERLKKLSPRIILAFDGDAAGEKAAERSTELGLSLGMEVKIASLPEGKDPADLVKENSSEWKSVLKDSTSAIEFFLKKAIEREKDVRKMGKLIEKKILPLVALVESAVERNYFISLVSKRTGIKEEALWEDLRRVKMPNFHETFVSENGKEKTVRMPRKTNIERRLVGIIFWQESQPHPTVDLFSLRGEIAARVGADYLEKLFEILGLEKETLIFEAESYYSTPEKLSQDIVELLNNLSDDVLREKQAFLLSELTRAEIAKDEKEIAQLSEEVQTVLKARAVLEERREKM
ncbi:MAG: DNA primase [Patescibacteria group bacterium]